MWNYFYINIFIFIYKNSLKYFSQFYSWGKTNYQVMFNNTLKYKYMSQWCADLIKTVHELQLLSGRFLKEQLDSWLSCVLYFYYLTYLL